jgi:DNA-binding LacI/PurR family transcriptional regulator
MNHNITLKDVARRAGVSYQTVSKVIHNQIQVTPQVRKRIETAIEELDYHLRTKSSHLIAYSWKSDRQTLSGPILEQFQHSIVECAEDSGYHILLFPHRAERDFYAACKELVNTRRVDGLILSSIDYDDPRIPILIQFKVPFVCFGRSDQYPLIPYMDVDNRQGMVMLVRHLIEQGHRRIAVLAWPESSRVGGDRLAGYRDALEAAGLPVDPSWIVRGWGEIDYGYQGGEALLDLPEKRRPTAIVTMFDTIAIGVIRAVESCGLRVGQDIAVTGCDDMAHYVKPELTSLRQPVWEVGRALINLLIALLKDEHPEEQQILFPSELIIRESSLGYAPSGGD